MHLSFGVHNMSSSGGGTRTLRTCRRRSPLRAAAMIFASWCWVAPLSLLRPQILRAGASSVARAVRGSGSSSGRAAWLLLDCLAAGCKPSPAALQWALAAHVRNPPMYDQAILFPYRLCRLLGK